MQRRFNLELSIAEKDSSQSILSNNEGQMDQLQSVLDPNEVATGASGMSLVFTSVSAYSYDIIYTLMQEPRANRRVNMSWSSYRVRPIHQKTVTT